MLMAERHREIVNLVNREGSVRVNLLARRFDVTEETIRRDLQALEMERKLLRSHGGAVNLISGEAETSFFERQEKETPEKTAIAREAVTRLADGDSILLDASTTAWHMARMMPNMRITVLTNAVKVALELANLSRVKVLFTGGTLSSASLSVTGPLAERTLKEYHVNKAFLSCKGLDPALGASDSSESQALLKRQMLGIADKRFLLADHSKFGVQSLCVFAFLPDFHEIITDAKVPAPALEALKSSGLKVTVAKGGEH
jgi:DeoR/GlpR family transcriptional regulator of sugar metabolism